MQKWILFIGLGIVLGVLPSLHLFDALMMYDEKRLFQVVLLVVIALFFAAGGFHSPAKSKLQTAGIYSNAVAPFVQWGIALFLGLGLLSLWKNGGWYYGVQELSLYIALLSLCMYTAKTYLRNPMYFEKGMVLLLSLFAGLYALKFFIGYGMHFLIDGYPLWPGQRYQNPLFGFANIRFFNQIQVWTLPLFIALATHGSVKISDSTTSRHHPKFYIPFSIFRKAITYFFLFIGALWWCLILEAGARGATLSLLIASCMVLVFYKQQAHLFIKKYLWVLLGGVVLKLLLFNILVHGVGVSFTRSKGLGRLDRWSAMITDILDKPLLGYGPMGFASLYNQYFAGHPHNSVLQIGYEMGIPAMIIASALILFVLYQWFIQSNQKSTMQTDGLSHIRIGISTSLLAGFGYSLFSGVIVMPLSQLWMALVAGWVLGIYKNSSDAGQASFSQAGIKKWVAVVTVLASVVFMSYVMITEVPNLKQKQQQYKQQKQDGTYFPRIWQQGKTGLEGNP